MSLYLHVNSGVSYPELKTLLQAHQKIAPSRDDLAEAVMDCAAELGQPFLNTGEVSPLVSWLAHEGLFVGPLPLDLKNPWPVKALAGFEVFSCPGAVLDTRVVALIRGVARPTRKFEGRVRWVEDASSGDQTVPFRVMALDTAVSTEDEAPALLLETNIDDMAPEALGYVLDRLLKEGARDAWMTPIVMKKSRSAVLLSVLAPWDRAEALTDVVFAETTTLGIRRRRVDTLMLRRRRDAVRTPYGVIQVKVGFFQGRVRSLHPEFEDCARAAEQAHVPLRVVAESAVQAWRLSRAVETGEEQKIMEGED
ncbi:LarC family nickel insertion protein [Sulfobacillus sp. DSM 109850]|uniref:LarC family nickel insertion protein n=2 Tax=Sulfobacillus harzensis TaxID=2729629 RepID=A0A7Y0L1A0_9FIRM|nr:LarC family nickel insertion protein [Sulfobacillus harzensis]